MKQASSSNALSTVIMVSYSRSISVRRAGLFVAFVGGLALLAAPVPAQDSSETIADVRCVVIGINLANLTDASQRSAGAMLALYYLGRLEGRKSKLDLESLLGRTFASMKPSEYESEGKRCGMALSKKGQQITAIGKSLGEHSRKVP